MAGKTRFGGAGEAMNITEMTLTQLLQPEGFVCSCGKRHCALPLRYLDISDGALEHLPEMLRKAVEGGVIFLVADDRTEKVAGKRVAGLLERHRFEYRHICLHGTPKVLPNEEYLEMLCSTCPENVSFVLGVGGGVINDLCKMLAVKRGVPCGIVATAPSMDGYASNSSAMELQGIKTTVYTTCPTLICCDTQILRQAPEEMLCAGFGDMAAKLISITDWKIAYIVTGEYYCEQIAALMQRAYRNVVENAQGIANREEPAVRCMTEGLVLSGIAMSFAGISRPASGMEHTISHLLEMFALARGAQPAAHGLQVGFGVREALRLYRRAYEAAPEMERCRRAAESFSEEKWETQMRAVFGAQAEPLIAQAVREGRNLPETRLRRAENAIDHWPQIRREIGLALAQADELEAALDRMHIPKLDEYGRLGYTRQEAENALRCSKDLRARYIFTSLCADIGLTV